MSALQHSMQSYSLNLYYAQSVGVVNTGQSLTEIFCRLKLIVHKILEFSLILIEFVA